MERIYPPETMIKDAPDPLEKYKELDDYVNPYLVRLEADCNQIVEERKKSGVLYADEYFLNIEKEKIILANISNVERTIITPVSEDMCDKIKKATKLNAEAIYYHFKIKDDTLKAIESMLSSTLGYIADIKTPRIEDVIIKILEKYGLKSKFLERNRFDGYTLISMKIYTYKNQEKKND